MLIKITLLSLLVTLGAGFSRSPEKKRRYMLVYQGGYCGGPGKVVGRNIYNARKCYEVAKDHGASAFSIGRQYRRGICWIELLPFTCDDYKQWKVPSSRPPHMHASDRHQNTRVSHGCHLARRPSQSVNHLCLCLSLSF